MRTAARGMEEAMPDLKPIETVYNGYRFRSRLEARWAVFFDTLGIRYEYEKEGYDLGGEWYLPDFWLPDFKCWVEIKGDAPSKRDLEKVKLFGHSMGNAPIALFQGLPGMMAQGDFYCLDLTDSSGGSCVMEDALFAWCHTCQVWTFDFGDWDSRYEYGGRELFNPDWTVWENPCKCYPPSIQCASIGLVERGEIAAKQARFGKNGRG